MYTSQPLNHYYLLVIFHIIAMTESMKKHETSNFSLLLIKNFKTSLYTSINDFLLAQIAN